MVEHEPLHFPVVDTAPVRAREKRPTDLDLARRLVEAGVARGANHITILGINCGERSAGLHSLAEELAEYFILVTIAGRMLLPDERVGSNGVEGWVVLGPQRAEFEELALQIRLQVEGHLNQPE